MGRKKRYRFSDVPPHSLTYHAAVTSKSLVERASEAAKVFEKYSSKSNLQRPGHILFVMAQQNESLFELSECARTPIKESTSPKVKSSPASSNPEERNSKVSIPKKKLSFGDSKKTEFSNIGFSPSRQCSNMYVSPTRKSGSTISTTPDRILGSEVQHLEFPSRKSSSPFKAVRRLYSPVRKSDSTTLASTDQTLSCHTQHQEFASSKSSSPSKAVRKLESPTRKPDEHINPTTRMQEYSSPIAKDKMTRKPDSGIPAKEFKMPDLPDKHVKEVTKTPKRPRLHDSLVENPDFISPDKVEIRIHSVEKHPDTSTHKGAKMSPSPSKCTTSSVEGESPLKFNTYITSVPIVKDDEIEIDVLSMSETDPSTCFISQSELENLFDDPSRVESIKKAVEDLLKDSIPPEKNKGNSHSDKKCSDRSPKEFRRNFIPDENVKNTIHPENNSSMLSNPNVLAYLQLRFKSVLSHRNKCLDKIYNFVTGFKTDVSFLYCYSKWMFLSVEDISLEGKLTKESGSIRDLKNLKDIIMNNAEKLSKHLIPITNTVKSDIQFWAQAFKNIRRLNEKIEPFLFDKSCSQTSVEALQEYETDLKMIWAKMDGKALILDGLISSLLGISANFLKLTKDFAKFLIMIEMMIPSSIAASKAKKLQASINVIKKLT